MVLNIIHLQKRTDRWKILQNELKNQKIVDFKIWNGIQEESPYKGIAKAHKQIVSWARDQNLPSVLIAEDDIKFTDTGAFEYFLKNEPPEYDLYLAGIYYGNIKEDQSVDDFAGLTLYKVSHKFYDTFLNASEELNLDRALSKKGIFIVCNPFTAIQYNGYSDNQKEYCDYDICLKDRKLFKRI